MGEYIAYIGEQFIIEWYYSDRGNSEALEYFEELSEKQQDRLLYLFKRMGDFGKINNTTQFRYEGDDIFAFKPQPDRFLCFFVKGRKIIVTNAFRKKTEKLPKNEKKKAISCRDDYNRRLKDGAYYD
jgi:phage-related protein